MKEETIQLLKKLFEKTRVSNVNIKISEDYDYFELELIDKENNGFILKSSIGKRHNNLSVIRVCCCQLSDLDVEYIEILNEFTSNAEQLCALFKEHVHVLNQYEIEELKYKQSVRLKDDIKKNILK